MKINVGHFSVPTLGMTNTVWNIKIRPTSNRQEVPFLFKPMNLLIKSVNYSVVEFKIFGINNYWRRVKV